MRRSGGSVTLAGSRRGVTLARGATSGRTRVGITAARVVLAVSLSALAACTTGDYALPQVGGGTSASAPPADPAQAYLDCMRQAGLPVGWLTVPPRNTPIVQLAPGPADLFLYETPNGHGGSSETVDQATKDAFARATTGYRLALNGVDRSADFQRCHADTGYDETVAEQPSGPDAEALAAMMAASLAWAGCARGAGWPQVLDPVMPPAGADSPPMVLLPQEITADQLRQLVADCPITPWAAPGVTASASAPGAGSVGDIYPTVGFDYPGLGGAGVPDSADPTYQRLSDLIGILYGPVSGLVYEGEGPPG